MAKRKHADIAEDHGVTIPVIKKLSLKGVNVYDFDAVAEALSKQRHRIKPDAKLSPELVNDSLDTLESLKAQALQATSLDDAKIIKEKAAALQGLIKVEREMGKLIPLAEVDERDTRIAAAIKAAMLKTQNDMPPVLEGLSSVDIRIKIGEHNIGILKDLADAQSEFWKDKEI